MSSCWWFQSTRLLLIYIYVLCGFVKHLCLLLCCWFCFTWCVHVCVSWCFYLFLFTHFCACVYYWLLCYWFMYSHASLFIYVVLLIIICMHNVFISASMCLFLYFSDYCFTCLLSFNWFVKYVFIRVYFVLHVYVHVCLFMLFRCYAYMCVRGLCLHLIGIFMYYVCLFRFCLFLCLGDYLCNYVFLDCLFAFSHRLFPYVLNVFICLLWTLSFIMRSLFMYVLACACCTCLMLSSSCMCLYVYHLCYVWFMLVCMHMCMFLYTCSFLVCFMCSCI